MLKLENEGACNWVVTGIGIDLKIFARCGIYLMIVQSKKIRRFFFFFVVSVEKSDIGWMKFCRAFFVRAFIDYYEKC